MSVASEIGTGFALALVVFVVVWGLTLPLRVLWRLLGL